MKIAFLEARDTLGLDLSAKYPAAYRSLKSYLAKYGPKDVDFVMCQSVEEVPEDVDLIGVSSTSQNWNEAVRISTQLSDFNQIFGGSHVTFLPGHSVEIDGLTYGCIKGEGEQAFGDLVWEFSNNPPQQPVTFLWGDFNNYPPPSLESPDDAYLFTSRGCPYSCSYCSSSAFWGKSRVRSPKTVGQDVQALVDRWDSPMITFWDDLICANMMYFEELVLELERRGLVEGRKYNFNIRPNLVTARLCDLLNRLNVSHVGMGCESVTERLLGVLKPQAATVALIQNGLDVLHEANIAVFTSWIVGSPGETMADLQKTFLFILKNIVADKMTLHCVNILMPLPGTEMWKKAKRMKVIPENPEDVDWDRLKVFAAWQNSTAGTVERWMEFRRNQGSYYMAQWTLPETELLKALEDFENTARQMYDVKAGNVLLQMELARVRG